MSMMMTEPDEKKQEELKPDQIIVKTLHMRGIPRWQFERYLGSVANATRKDCYVGDGWQVTLSAERQECIGVFSLIAVDVTLAVEKDQFDDFLLSFRKNFLRGGG